MFSLLSKRIYKATFCVYGDEVQRFVHSTYSALVVVAYVFVRRLYDTTIEIKGAYTPHNWDCAERKEQRDESRNRLSPLLLCIYFNVHMNW